MADPKDYRQVLTDKLIEQLEAGTAPWQKPWDARDGGDRLPYNPTTDKPYRGANSLMLSAVAEAQGYGDPRWATYKQAEAEGWQVRKGERGTVVEYWKFSEQRPMLDGKGKPVMGDDGTPRTIDVQLESPRAFRAVVFNAQQMDGVPELSKAPREYAWNPVERAEKIMEASGAKVFHDQADRAFYSPAKDSIHLPGRDQFKDQAAYYSTALHELGHWSGHESRLKRDFGGAFGSEQYAKEELRAELSSYFMAEKLGIPHEPGQHAAYVKSWIKVLGEDKNEIYRAARDAEKITEYVLSLDRPRELEQGQERMQLGTSRLAPEDGIGVSRFRVELVRPDGQVVSSERLNDPETAMGAFVAVAKTDFAKEHGKGAYVQLVDSQLELDASKVAGEQGYRVMFNGDRGQALYKAMYKAYEQAQQLEPIRRGDFGTELRGAVQEEVARAVEVNPGKFLDRFKELPQSLEGRFISADTMKETFPQYAESPAARNVFNAPTHNAAAVLASEQLRRVLAEPAEPGKDAVALLTGIPGSGKTSAVLEGGKLPTGTHAVYEGQLANPEVAIAKVQQVLDAGYKPVIVAVHTHPEKALDNTLQRFDEVGRGASINVMAKIQAGLPEGLQAVRDKFGDAVDLRVIDRREFGEPKELKGWNHLPVLQSEGNHEQIKQRLSQHLEQQRDRLSEDGYRQAVGLAPILRERSVDAGLAPQHARAVDGPEAAPRAGGPAGLTPARDALRPHDIPPQGTPAYGELVRASIAERSASGEYLQLQAQALENAPAMKRFAMWAGDEPLTGRVVAETKHSFAVQPKDSEQLVLGLHKLNFKELPSVGQVVEIGPSQPGVGRSIRLVEPEKQLATERTELAVPFKEKEAAKQLGAKWDKEAKGWYAPAGTDLAPLAKWMPQEGQVMAPARDVAPAKGAERSALEDPQFREQLQGLKDVTAAIDGRGPAAPVRLSTDERAPVAPTRDDQAKTWLAVPYPERIEAREAGAKWDKEAKSWYAPAGADLDKLDRWVPKQDLARGADRSTPSDPRVEFAAALKAAGLIVDGEPVMDGKRHRVPVVGGKDGGKDGSYVGHLDGRPSGHIQNYLTGTKENWKAEGVQLNAEERALLSAQAQIAKQARAAELSEQHGLAADRASAKWERLADVPPSGSNAYLARKGVEAHGVKYDGERLVVPVRDVDGKLWSLQSISPEEGVEKMFEKGGRKTGNMHVMGTIKPGAEVLVAEGYATGASLHQATGKAVAVAFDAGNIDSVVGAIKERHPTSPVFIMGDNDQSKSQNRGAEAAIAAAEKHQVGVALPQFREPGKASDFNDLHAKEGLGAVKAQVEAALGRSMAQSREDAGAIARQQLGDGVAVSSPGANTRHTGEVLGVTGYHATQATGRNAAVVHAVADLDQRPTPGKVSTIQYQDGRGTVQDRSVGQQKQLER